MAKKLSAGVLLYRTGSAAETEVLLVHPGGPFFRKKDDGYWTIPKGEPEDGETMLQTARREFREEMGGEPPPPESLVDLGQAKQKGGKVVHGFGCADCLPADWKLASNEFEMEWPPRSGKRQKFPEIDRAQWFPVEVARVKMNEAQTAFLDRLMTHLGL